VRNVQLRQVRPAVRYVREEKVGNTFARHAGARLATGELLVFTDDDVTFSPSWLKAYSDAFRKHPEMVAAGGPARPAWEVPPPQWLLDYMGDGRWFGILALLDPYPDFRLEAGGYFFWGHNVAIRRQTLFDVGGFNPELCGDRLVGDGECGLRRKLAERGMLIGYVPEASIYHHIPAHRMTVKYFRERMANQGACDLYTEYHAGIPSVPALCRRVAGIVAANSRCWVSALRRRGRTDKHSLDTQLEAARTLSLLRHLLRLMLDTGYRDLVLKKDWLNN
jgi:glucosyl-dolichyl phosphate glucuronosyltransferase